MKKAKEKQNSKGITLIALVVTIIILLILAGITITTLFGENGLITTANATKAQQELGKIKDIIGLSYLDTVAQGQGKASDEEILTEAFAKLSAAGYEVKTINSGESLKGIILQDTTGKNISEINIEQGKTTTIKISLDKQGGEAKNYVKIEDKWYEITIDNGIIQVSKEGQKELEGKAYTIKLIPPSTGATIKVGETNITNETTIVSGAELEITAGDTTGNYNFNVTVEDTEFTINPTITVVANPVYVTSITISPTTLNLEIGGDTAQLTATVLPATATQTVTWHSSDEEVASVSETGLVTPGTKEGTATITAISGDGRNVTSNECAVTLKGEKVVPTSTIEELQANFAEKNEIVVDKYKNKITVPKGFKIVSPTEDSTVIYAYDRENGTSTQKPVVQDGIVIKDSAGNQFVWIPVGEIKNDAVENTTNKTTITLGRYTFDVGSYDSTTKSYDGSGEEHLVQAAYTDANPTNYLNTDAAVGTIDQGSSTISELSIKRSGISPGDSDDLNATAKDLAGFVNSVKLNGGYYIARYEASYGSGYNSGGSSNALKYANAKPLSQPSTAHSDKSMIYTPGTLWNRIPQLYSSKVAQNMYEGNKDINNNEVGVESDLINSYAWDTAIVFIQKYSSNAAYSKQNSKNTSATGGLADTGERAGTTDKVCNIYDMASNTREWTTEFCTYANAYFATPCVSRSGDYLYESCCSSDRDVNLVWESSHSAKTPWGISFRVVLYVGLPES